MTVKTHRHALIILSILFALSGCNGNELETMKNAETQETAGVSLQKETNQNQLQGNATYRERIALPENAILTVRLNDVSIADAASVTIAETQIPIEHAVPIAFSLTYNTSDIIQSNTYSLSARIEHGNSLLFITDTHFNPFSDVNSSNLTTIQLNMIKASNAKPNSKLTDTYWRLDKLPSGINVMEEGQTKEVSMILKSHDDLNSVQGFSGCNNFSGSFVHNDIQLTFGQIVSTLKFCEKGSSVETEFQQQLALTASYKIVGEQLNLMDSNQEIIAVFSAIYLQ